MTKFATRYIKNMFYPLNVPDTLTLKCGDMVLARTEKGEEALKAFLVNEEVEKIWAKSNMEPEAFQVIRILNDKDKETLELIKKEEVEGFLKCQGLIKQHHLGMNLVQCRLTFDRKKITFYYTAPERIDFRNLLKDLTQIFKRVRIDLRHIGVRDETAILQGCGVCGREFCCSSFVKKFTPTNVKLAKDQGMPIAPGKISGTCGRLLCCLSYEYSNYIEAAKGMPPVGSPVMTPDGLGKVCSLHFLNASVQVKLEDGKIKDYVKNDIEMIDSDVNVEIDVPSLNYQQDDENIDISQLEDDKNSSTGNI